MDNKPTYAELEIRVHELEQTNAACEQFLAELRQNEERLRRLWEQSPLGYQSLDAEGCFVEVNKRWIDIMGYAREEVIGRSFAEFLHPDWQEHFRLNFPRFKAIGEVLGVEFEMVKKNGSLITVSFNGKISRGDDGQFQQTHCIFHDITARKEAEESLRRRAEEVERLMEAVPAVVWIAHGSSCQTITGNPFANMVYEALPGENVSATKQPNIRRFFTSDGREFSAEDLPMQKAVATNQDVKDAEIHVQLPSGKSIVMFGNAVPLRDQDGNVRGCIGAFLDITERKQIDEALRRLNETLEQQVAERTNVAEARAKQLRALAVELIETEERERRNFAHLLHDDLQQMLAAAKMQIEVIAETLPAGTMLSNVVALLNESISKTRRLSRDLSPAIMHRTGLISALGWLSRQVREQFGLHVELDIETDLLMERTPQKVFLFRAVQELLFNSVKHAGVKSARVTVSSTEDSITVAVSDKGCGFDSESLEKCTDDIGLGLLTIKERAGYVGGKFSIESAPGQGSRFTLTVPNAAAIGEEEAALESENLSAAEVVKAIYGSSSEHLAQTVRLETTTEN